MKLPTFIIAVISSVSFAQSDTLNQTDTESKKHGYWIVYGYMRPEKKYADSLKIEEGNYINDKKFGHWFFFSQMVKL